MTSRAIKFRAWNFAAYKMYSVQALEWDYKTKQLMAVTLVDYPNNTLLLTEQVHQIELMQFTGLVDKNGKDIYEGDILLIGVSDKERFYPNVFVRWMTYRWQFTSSSEFPGWEFTDRYVENGLLEVIGNIYEHPNLLKDVL